MAKILLPTDFVNYIRRVIDVQIFIASQDDQFEYDGKMFKLRAGDAIVVENGDMYWLERWQVERDFMLNPKRLLPEQIKALFDRLAVVEPEMIKIQSALDRIATLEQKVDEISARNP